MITDVHPHGFQALFVAYLSDQISDTQFRKYEEILDSCELFSDERQALATFIADAATSGHELRAPSLAEMTDLLDSVRLYPYRLAAN